MQKKPKVSIITVAYGDKGSVLNSINSIYASKPSIPFEIIVIDNLGDKTLKSKLLRKFPNVVYIKSPRNIGFGAGNNLGEKHAKGDYLFFLNPDTLVQNNAVDALYQFMEKNQDSAIAAPLLSDKNKNTYPLQGTRQLTPMAAIFSLSFLHKLIPNNPVAKKFYILNWDKRVNQEVDVVPGTAFMIRRGVFKNVKGFDKKFFLYFEEYDICRRVKDLGYKIYMVPRSKLVHLWGRSTNKIAKEKIKKIFRDSRQYYFTKHYNKLTAIMIELFLRLNKLSLVVLSILSLAAFLRYYKLSSFMNFIGDFGWYYLSARDFLLERNIPLTGIPSSVPVLRQGAIFTWLLAIALKIFRFNPVSGAYLTSFVGVLAVLVTYKLVSSWFNQKIGLLASLFVATSPFIVEFDRLPFVVGPMYLLTLFIALSFTKILDRRKVHFFLLGIWVAVLYQFELAGFIMVPIIILAYLSLRKKINAKDLLRFVVGGLIGLLPFIIQDIKSGVYLQTLGFLGWLVTKVAENFFGLFNIKDKSEMVLQTSEFIRRFIYPASKPFATAVFFSSLFYFIHIFTKLKDKKYYSFIFLWFFIAASGFAVRGIFSDAYLPLLFFPLVIFVSVFFDFLIRRFGRVGLIIYFMMILGNINFLWNNKFLSDKRFFITFSQRSEVADFIKNNSKYEKYNLQYVGPGDEFHSGDNHWKYLLWWKGNEPGKDALKTYLIYEFPDKSIDKFAIIKDFGNVKVGVSE